MTASTKDCRFTVDDYLALPEGFPAQLIDGGLVKEPSPVPWHTSVATRIFKRLEAVAGVGRVLVAPTDVFIDRWNVLQPDVMVLPPDMRVSPAMTRVPIPVLVVEVLSPGTSALDCGLKCATYLRAGVAEVWLVDPDGGGVEVRTVRSATRYEPDDAAASAAVPGFLLRGRSLLA